MNMNSYKCCVDGKVEHSHILSQLSLIKLLSEKNRLQILCVLSSDSHTVNELVDHLSVSQSLVSHHLIDLKKLCLVVADKSGRQVVYSLTNKGKQIIQLLNSLSGEEKK